MTVTLRPITRDNLWAVVDLKPHPGQEAFVEANVASIANAYVEPTFVPLGIYAGDELVGFAMHGQHPDTGAWWVIRLMIEREHQAKGYGRAAKEAVIEMMAAQVGCQEIVTSFNPSNSVACLARVSPHRRDRGRRAVGSAAARRSSIRSVFPARPAVDHHPARRDRRDLRRELVPQPRVGRAGDDETRRLRTAEGDLGQHPLHAAIVIDRGVAMPRRVERFPFNHHVGCSLGTPQ